MVTLNGIKNRCTKWQCVTIPSNCPHQGHNDTEEEVVILWNYLSLTDKVDRSTHHHLYNISYFRSIPTRTTTGSGWRVSCSSILEGYFRMIYKFIKQNIIVWLNHEKMRSFKTKNEICSLGILIK